MWHRVGSIVVCLMALAGCATQPRPPAVVHWQDQSFNYRADRVSETMATLVALDPALAAELADPAVRDLGREQRIEYLMKLFFPQGLNRFAYAVGPSTGAAETWRNKRGDCMSLTLLTYSAARALAIPAQMQEVRVPVVIDRRGHVDFLAGHVNVRFPDAPALKLGSRNLPGGELIIDFEPQVGSKQRGRALSDDQMLARFYNNRGAENFAQQSDDLAYAYFKAAIVVDPEFAAARRNLAQLYLRHALVDDAERLLRQTIELKDGSAASLRSLHGLLLSQGRATEAQQYADLLQRYQDDDPYYWLGLGLDHIQHNRYVKAIDALERAATLASGFEEIHRYLALAYTRNGQQEEARKQLVLLAAITHDPKDRGIDSRSIGRDAQQRSLQ